MGDKTGIEWTDATWNPTRGCSRLSEGCRNCYAETVARRFSGPGQPYEGLIARSGQWNGKITVAEHLIDQPLRWRKPRMIFVDSMSDLFHENVPDEVIAQVFSVMAHCIGRHTFQVLTKRPERMRDFISRCAKSEAGYMTHNGENPRGWDPETGEIVTHPTWHRDKSGRMQVVSENWPLPNVWLGVSVEDQATADERIPLLLQVPARVRWLSMEPLLGPVDLTALDYDDGMASIDALRGTHGVIRPHGGSCNRIDWVVVGGESGPNARPMHPDWARSLRDQCVEAGTPMLFKQWGEWAPNWLNDDRGNKLPSTEWMDRIGKKAAGRLLDGELWDQYPEVNR